jgi:integrase
VKINAEYVEKHILTHLFLNYKYNYVRHLMISFRTFFSRAVEWKMIKSNPFSKKVPKAEKKSPRYLRQDEIERMREYFCQDFLPSWQNRLVFLTINTGLRKSEVFNLTWEHVDLVNEQMIFPGKGSKERVVPLNNHALAILNELAKEKVKHINRRVFYEINSPDSINTAWRKFRSRTGIKVRFHDLRVTYASYFVMNGGDILTLKDILGHEDLKTIMVYATLSREALHKKKNVVGF